MEINICDKFIIKLQKDLNSKIISRNIFRFVINKYTVVSLLFSFVDGLILV